MPYPCYYTNADADKKFKLTKDLQANGQSIITAKEYTWNPFATPQWGSVDWEVDGKKFLLHTIQSHPEKGTGLGSLLMHLAATESLEAGCTVMHILSAAQSERDFYYLMGCTLDKSGLANFDEASFSVADWTKLCESCPVIGDTATVLKTSAKSVYKRWA